MTTVPYLLPKPPTSRADLAQAYAAPRTDVERLIAGAWVDILDQDRIGIHDNFFDLGGHSLLAARLVGRITEELGIDLPLRTLFAAPTVAQLSAYVAQADGPDEPWGKDHHLGPVLPLREQGERTPLFCIHPAMGLGWGFTALLPHLKGRPIYTVQAPGLTDKDLLPQTIEDAAARYVRCIRSIQPHGPYLLVGRSFGGLAAYEMATQLEQAGEEIGLLALLDSLPTAPDTVPGPELTDAIELETVRILWRNGRPGEPVPPTTVRLNRAPMVAAFAPPTARCAAGASRWSSASSTCVSRTCSCRSSTSRSGTTVGSTSSRRPRTATASHPWRRRRRGANSHRTSWSPSSTAATARC
jgi:nonribosomal peptide synthetase DhbF